MSGGARTTAGAGETGTGRRGEVAKGGRRARTKIAQFLDELSLCCDAAVAAERVGLTLRSVLLRRRHVPEFAQAWTEALGEGELRLEEGLIACAMGAATDGSGRVNPELAIKVLQLRGRGKGGTKAGSGGSSATGGSGGGDGEAGRSKAGPEPSAAEVEASLLRRLDEVARLGAR